MIADKAKQYGYEPVKDVNTNLKKAFDYVQGLMNEIKLMSQKQILLKNTKIENLTMEQILKLMLDPQIFSPSYAKFRKALVLQAMKPKHQEEIRKINERVEKAWKSEYLKVLTYRGNHPRQELEKKLIALQDEDLIKFFVKVNIAASNDLLIESVLAGSEKMIQLSLQLVPEESKKAGCTTAFLHFCLRKIDNPKHNEIIKPLLENGADVAFVKEVMDKTGRRIPDYMNQIFTKHSKPADSSRDETI